MGWFRRLLRDRRGFFPHHNDDDESSSAAPPSENSDGEPDLESRIVQAWFAKRRNDFLTETNNNNTNAPRKSTPIDVDNVSAWELKDNEVPSCSPRKGRNHKITPEQQQHHSSTFSLAGMSDQTPIMSNLRPGASIAGSSSVKTNNSVTDTTVFTLRDYFDPKRWQGKLLLSLILFLSISVAAIVLTAVLTSDNDKQEESNKVPEVTTAFPTLSPTPFPTSLEPTTGGPTTVEQPSLTPSFLPSMTPSASPSLSLSGIADNLQLINAFFGVQIGETFGSNLQLSGDGKVLAVGAPTFTENGSLEIGRVQVYERNAVNNLWQERGDSIVGQAQFDNTGSAVALNFDGSVLALSEPKQTNGGNVQAGSVRVFQYNPVSRNYDIEVGRALQGDTALALFGSSLALSQSGQRLVVGSLQYTNNLRFQGRVSAYEFEPTRNRWRPLGAPIDGTAEGDWFGSALSLYEDDTVFALAASAPHNDEFRGYVKVFELDGNADWIQIGNQMTNQDLFEDVSGFVDEQYGFSLSLTKTGEDTLRLATGVPFKTHPASGIEDTGVTVVYDLNSDPDDWEIVGEPLFYTNNKGNKFGDSVKLVNNGNLLLVGAPGASESTGSVLFFRYINGAFEGSTEEPPPTLQGAVPGEDFGVALDAQYHDDTLVLVVGALRGSDTRGDPGYVAILEG